MNVRTIVGSVVLIASITACTASRPVLTQERSTAAGVLPMSSQRAAAFVKAKLPSVSWSVDTKNYRAAADVSVIVGQQMTGIGNQPAYIYLFHKGQYAGQGTDGPRIDFAVAGPSGGAITVRFSHYRPGDGLCCPSMPFDVVHYRWDGAQVHPDVHPPGDNSPGAEEGE